MDEIYHTRFQMMSLNKYKYDKTITNGDEFLKENRKCSNVNYLVEALMIV